jgi:uncharacterized protein (TIGR03382 family)
MNGFRAAAAAVAMLAGFTAVAEPAPVPGCDPGGAMPVIESRGMDWSVKGYEPAALAGLDRDKVAAWASAWRDAAEAAGMSGVALAGLAAEVTSWGAIQKSKTAGIGKYDYSVTDAVVEAFAGRAILVLSAACNWDHPTGIKPADRAAFKKYVEALVKRYDGDDDFGIADGTDPSYPDVDGTGKTTIADSEAPKEVKLAWAASHRVAGYMVETDSAPAGAALADYAEVAKDTLAAAFGASKTAVAWLAPFPATMPRSEWQARFGGLVVPAGSETRLHVIVAVPSAGADFAGSQGVDAFAKVAKWHSEAGFTGVRLVLGGVTLGARQGAAGCPDSRCGPAMQAEQAVKVLARAAAAGASAVAYAGSVEAKGADTGTGLAVMEFAASGADVDARPAARAIAMLRPALAGDGTVAEVPTGLPPVPSTTAVRGRSCAEETDTVAWYDWTDEVAPGAPYGDLVKKVRIEAPRDAVRAAVLDGSGMEVADADLEDGGDGTTRILVRRSPVLVMARPGGWIEPEPVPEEVAASDEAADVAEEAQAGGGSGGCGAGASPASLAWPLLALAAILVPRRRA